MGINRQIVNMAFFDHKIIKMTINHQIWQLCPEYSSCPASQGDAQI